MHKKHQFVSSRAKLGVGNGELHLGLLEFLRGFEESLVAPSLLRGVEDDEGFIGGNLKKNKNKKRRENLFFFFLIKSYFSGTAPNSVRGFSPGPGPPRQRSAQPCDSLFVSNGLVCKRL